MRWVATAVARLLGNDPADLREWVAVEFAEAPLRSSRPAVVDSDDDLAELCFRMRERNHRQCTIVPRSSLGVQRVSIKMAEIEAV